MKFAIHLSTYTKEWAEDLVPFIKRSKEIGYDGVEIPLMDLNSIDIEQLKAVLKENDIEPICGTGLNPNEDISSTDDDIRQRGILRLTSCIDICHEIGSKQLGGVLYAPWGQKISRDQAKDNYRHSIESLQTVADYAKKMDVTLCLEILNRYETYYMNTVEEGIGIAKLINRDNVGLHFDTFHGHIEEKNMYDAIVSGREHIKHVHFCENTRGVPTTGQVNWPEVVRGLKDINYSGWIAIENFVNCNCEVGNETAIWRQIEPDGDYAAVHGYKNMRKLFEEV